MLIGQLSKETGLSKDTIRFYEKMGLIDADERRAGTRIYKEFSSEMVERLTMIAQGKALGFTLGEIKYLIQTWRRDAMTTAEKVKVIDCKLEEVSEKIQQLEKIKTYLIAKRMESYRNAT
jgi:MerR family transcriptional regulator, copper efflux regulator